MSPLRPLFILTIFVLCGCWQKDTTSKTAAPHEDPTEVGSRLEEIGNWVEAAEVYRLHALPEEWRKLDYEDFLDQRRELMVEVIRDTFERIK